MKRNMYQLDYSCNIKNNFCRADIKNASKLLDVSLIDLKPTSVCVYVLLLYGNNFIMVTVFRK